MLANATLPFPERFSCVASFSNHLLSFPLIHRAGLAKGPDPKAPRMFAFEIECLADPIDMAIRILRNTDVRVV